MKYRVRNEVKSLAKYVAGKPIEEVKRELGISKVVKLASNENPLGCSPKVIETIKSTLTDVNMYPDASSYEFKKLLSEKLNVNKDMIFCGAGSDSLINVLCTTILDKDDESIMPELTFPRYESNTLLMGAKPVKIPMKNNYLDLEAMVNAITDKTKIIWFCNPNNPTGSMFTAKEFNNIVDKIPEDILIIMDEAYCEYVISSEYPNSIELLKKYPNIIILRTFSKAYGLASLRFGYGIAREEIVDYLNRVINAFDTNLFAQKSAVAALNDEGFLEKVKQYNYNQREYLSIQFEKMGLEYVKSEANFILVNVKGDDKPIHEYLLKHGYIIRPGFLLGIPGFIRVSIGTEEENKEFCKLLFLAIQERDLKV
ncbi:histidinol-phosphate transaminase [Clostridium septicum]|uniref:Histidinol-phosphate aminotransferase n=1 Tax=Clostridium septicum TaxID=1504 RepID=A0A9N7PLR3_CLOSE|nr:histidinol-phosphate transaminase [Clostridium septicum]AYE34127.1 histidinol-phosphate transaminase [Clostridium septicum]MDU1313075.1 histidinol-phosphate transaminase [Clostridium septicum]QAS59494.1 histidinol-phosphate transaminase [Clostridium septicum]UEC21245.1 histidinol-phosphate transaminase [Clostridium septicum]USS00709.1 histidinol-phosphate transaminase [Clostridium septicum]